ncbi:MAG: hypoxanthine phosphoribosyltransferase [Desulfovibrionaceae bacterium]|nr:hypoxanthine phosphoribosyltransferase [Desulfovibrionaceae bacterium]
MIDDKIIQTMPGESLTQIFSAEEIAKRVSDLGHILTSDYAHEPLVCICVLGGAVVFFSDLVRSIRNPRLEFDFLRLSSYNKSDESSGNVTVKQWISSDLTDKHILLVEDIIDSGCSMHFFLEKFHPENVRSVRLAALIDKKERRQYPVHVDYSCFNLDKGFLVGYGLDYAERYRHLPAIYELKIA